MKRIHTTQGNNLSFIFKSNCEFERGKHYLTIYVHWLLLRYIHVSSIIIVCSPNREITKQVSKLKTLESQYVLGNIKSRATSVSFPTCQHLSQLFLLGLPRCRASGWRLRTMSCHCGRCQYFRNGRSCSLWCYYACCWNSYRTFRARNCSAHKLWPNIGFWSFRWRFCCCAAVRDNPRFPLHWFHSTTARLGNGDFPGWRVRTYRFLPSFGFRLFLESDWCCPLCGFKSSLCFRVSLGFTLLRCFDEPSASLGEYFSQW